MNKRQRKKRDKKRFKSPFNISFDFAGDFSRFMIFHVKTKRNYIDFDLDPEYFAIAKEKLKNLLKDTPHICTTSLA